MVTRPNGSSTRKTMWVGAVIAALQAACSLLFPIYDAPPSDADAALAVDATGSDDAKPDDASTPVTPEDFFVLLVTDAGSAPFSLTPNGTLVQRGCGVAEPDAGGILTKDRTSSSTPFSTRQIARWVGPGESRFIFPTLVSSGGTTLSLADLNTNCSGNPAKAIGGSLAPDGGLQLLGFPTFSPDGKRLLVTNVLPPDPPLMDRPRLAKVFAVNVVGGEEPTVFQRDGVVGTLAASPPLWTIYNNAVGVLYVVYNGARMQVRFAQDLPQGVPTTGILLDCDSSALGVVRQLLVFSRGGETRLMFVASQTAATEPRIYSVPFGSSNCAMAESLVPAFGGSDVSLSPDARWLAFRSTGVLPDASPTSDAQPNTSGGERIYLKSVDAPGTANVCTNPPPGNKDYGALWRGRTLVWTRAGTQFEDRSSTLMTADIVDGVCTNERRLLPASGAIAELAGQNDCRVADSGFEATLWFLLLAMVVAHRRAEPRAQVTRGAK
jgi:hypothetical protein